MSLGGVLGFLDCLKGVCLGVVFGVKRLSGVLLRWGDEGDVVRGVLLSVLDGDVTRAAGVALELLRFLGDDVALELLRFLGDDVALELLRFLGNGL